MTTNAQHTDTCSNCGGDKGIFVQHDPQLVYCADCDHAANNQAREFRGIE